jgi:hypothetical protein
VPRSPGPARARPRARCSRGSRRGCSELTWAEGEGDTVVHVEINASGAGTLLVLEHRNLSAENAAGLGAGWHAHLVALRDVLGGREVVEDRWRPLFDSLRPGYVELVDAVA